MLLLLVSISMIPITLGLRISDAWVEDIETLRPAMSNRIETYVFPTTREENTSDNYRIQEVTGDVTKGLSFEPMYFKFRNKLEDEVKLTPIDRSFGSQVNKFTIRGNHISDVYRYHVISNYQVQFLQGM